MTYKLFAHYMCIMCVACLFVLLASCGKNSNESNAETTHDAPKSSRYTADDAVNKETESAAAAPKESSQAEPKAEEKGRVATILAKQRERYPFVPDNCFLGNRTLLYFLWISLATTDTDIPERMISTLDESYEKLTEFQKPKMIGEITSGIRSEANDIENLKVCLWPHRFWQPRSNLSDLMLDEYDFDAGKFPIVIKGSRRKYRVDLKILSDSVNHLANGFRRHSIILSGFSDNLVVQDKSYILASSESISLEVDAEGELALRIPPDQAEELLDSLPKSAREAERRGIILVPIFEANSASTIEAGTSEEEYNIDVSLNAFLLACKEVSDSPVRTLSVLDVLDE